MSTVRGHAPTRDDDPDALRAMGNGRLLAYLAGPDVRTLFGATYSSPELATLSWSRPGEWAERPVIDGVGRFDVAQASVDVFVEADIPALTYVWSGNLGHFFTVAPASATAGGWRRLQLGAELDAVIVEIARGGLLYRYPSSQPFYLVVLGKGIALSVETDGAHNGVSGAIQGGDGWLSIVAGADFASVHDSARQLADARASDRLSAAIGRQESKLFGLSVSGAGSTLSVDLARHAAMQIVAQQSDDGGIIAGHNYALAYLRDQFGTAEGLLALGLYEQAKSNILFRWNKWRMFGTLANAETMSGEAIRHRHENDEVEQTAYTVLQVTRLVALTHDLELIDVVAPMLEWCMEVQGHHLVEGALPFNGDETYVAGSILPRWALNDGSMESTMLYYEAIRALRPFRGRTSLGGVDWSSKEADAESIVESFDRNFVRGDRLVTNSLMRRDAVTPPASRQGVCENCLNFPTVVRRTPSGRYTCWLCDGVEMAPAPRTELSVISASLAFALVGSELVPAEVQRAETARVFEVWEREECLPPEGPAGFSVGYDEGLLLRALCAIAHPGAGRVARALAERRDRYGMWAEFYSRGLPVGTRCRPWESGMNLAALATFDRSGLG